jgi:hypothetical protein
LFLAKHRRALEEQIDKSNVMMPKVSDVYINIRYQFGNDAEGVGCLNKLGSIEKLALLIG